MVKKGDVLFELDRRPYKALLDQAKAKVAQDEAQLRFDEAEYQRNLKLVGTRAVSQTDLDKTAAARGVDLANVAASKALVESRQLDREYTKVLALRSVLPHQEQVLAPGFFGRVRVNIGRLHNALLVNERAIDTHQGQKILYVVNAKTEVVSRPVRPGALHGGMREITDGLSPGERV